MMRHGTGGGGRAPDFEPPDQEGGIARLGPFRGRKDVVLCFHPQNRILGCPSGKAARMAGSLAGSYPDIRATGSVLFAVSADAVGDQKRFVEEHSVPYRHLSDPSKGVCRRYAGLNVVGLAKRPPLS